MSTALCSVCVILTHPTVNLKATATELAQSPCPTHLPTGCALFRVRFLPDILCTTSRQCHCEWSGVAT